jgi:signal transduction histidine kinase
VEQEEKDNHSELLFQLEDTGTGIDKESLPQLFKPFHQGNVSIARRFGGSGLGLSIAKSVGSCHNAVVLVCNSDAPNFLSLPSLWEVLSVWTP